MGRKSIKTNSLLPQEDEILEDVAVINEDVVSSFQSIRALEEQSSVESDNGFVLNDSLCVYYFNKMLEEDGDFFGEITEEKLNKMYNDWETLHRENYISHMFTRKQIDATQTSTYFEMRRHFMEGVSEENCFIFLLKHK